MPIRPAGKWTAGASQLKFPISIDPVYQKDPDTFMMLIYLFPYVKILIIDNSLG